MNKSADKKPETRGELFDSIVILKPHESASEFDKIEYEIDVFLERTAKVTALFEHYDIEEEEPDAWEKLCMKIADDYFPGFQVRNPPGRRAGLHTDTQEPERYASMQEGFWIAIVDLQKGNSRDEKIRNLEAICSNSFDQIKNRYYRYHVEGEPQTMADRAERPPPDGAARIHEAHRPHGRHVLPIVVAAGGEPPAERQGSAAKGAHLARARRAEHEDDPEAEQERLHAEQAREDHEEIDGIRAGRAEGGANRTRAGDHCDHHHDEDGPAGHLLGTADRPTKRVGAGERRRTTDDP